MDSKLSIVTGCRDGNSYMKDVYVTPPFRVVPVGQLKKDGGAYLMITSSSPGILNGDNYYIDVLVEENARLQLLSQSYQRLFNMDGHATQNLVAKMEANTSFFYVPHPIVPHENSTFISTNTIYIEDDCDLMMGEIITCGRKHHGEVFKYSHFQNKTEVFHKQKLIFKDNILLRPQIIPLDSIGCLETFTHQGTLVYLNTKNIKTDDFIEEIYEMMSTEKELEFGISSLQNDGFVLRLLGHGGEQMFNCFQKIQKKVWAFKTENILS
ncbi:urease accessory protein UreD [Flavobacterium sp. KMS]|uniref:urease accessory protein UreD n=1 Tax=Flavobacterium sp. KMS TaxID=1566023 RepID=UPI00058092EF|nr:urease accessory protein UreD [Flavobacterium sp. KMS]KIA97455.1 urease accessory protein UreD [Flavobacterium sp. KMS]